MAYRSSPIPGRRSGSPRRSSPQPSHGIPRDVRSSTSARTCRAGSGRGRRGRHGGARPARRGARRRGGLYTENLRTARLTDEYVLSGGQAVLELLFTQHGFRYAEVTGYPGDLAPSSVVARVVHSDIAATGSFESSQAWLDRLFRIIDWEQRGNSSACRPTARSVTSGSAGGYAQVFARTACYNRDVAAFFGKWLDDVADAQLDRAFTDVARAYLARAWRAAGGRRSAHPVDGVEDVRGPRCAGPALRRHDRMDGLHRARQPFVSARTGAREQLNDWLMSGTNDTPHELLATAYWAHDTALIAESPPRSAEDDADGTRRCAPRSGPRSPTRSRPPTARSPPDPDRVRPRPVRAAEPRRAAGRRGRHL